MKRETVSALLLGVALVAAGCQQKKDGAAGQPASAGASPTASPASPNAGMSDDQKAIYALGAAMGQQHSQMLAPLKLTPAEFDVLMKGMRASLAGQKPEFDIEQYGQRLQARAQANAASIAAEQKQKAAEFTAKAAQEPGAVKTTTGLIFKSVSPGSGPTPKATDVVQVNYRGMLTDGSEFDSSAKHGGAAQFQVKGGVIPCWTEALQRMKVGEKARIVCPSEIAYGDQGSPPVIPPGATLVFDVELVGIGAKQAAAPRPQGR